MKKFTLYWSYGTTTMVVGLDILDAIEHSSIHSGELHCIDYYEDEQGNRIQIAGQAKCGCVHHAEEGLSCEHDLRLAGLI